MKVQLPQAHNHEKYDNNGNDWYFRFDYDKISYKYILSITLSWMGLFDTYNLRYCEEIRKVTEIIIYILDILSTENTQLNFMHASKIFHLMCSMQVSKSALWW